MPLTEETKTAIFNKVKKQLETCCPPMVGRKSAYHTFEIIGNKPVPYGYKKEIIPGMFFAAAAIRKDMVSFYFFPIYMNAAAFKGIAPNLFKTLKGKSCFNLKKPEQVNEKELATLLKKGMTVWKKAGYMK